MLRSCNTGAGYLQGSLYILVRSFVLYGTCQMRISFGDVDELMAVLYGWILGRVVGRQFTCMFALNINSGYLNKDQCGEDKNDEKEEKVM